MARWLIHRTGRGNDSIVVYYDNLITGMRYPLGKLSSDIPDDMIVDWIFSHGDPAYGDRIQLSDGTMFVFRAPEGASA